MSKPRTILSLSDRPMHIVRGYLHPMAEIINEKDEKAILITREAFESYSIEETNKALQVMQEVHSSEVDPETFREEQEKEIKRQKELYIAYNNRATYLLKRLYRLKGLQTKGMNISSIYQVFQSLLGRDETLTEVMKKLQLKDEKDLQLIMSSCCMAKAETQHQIFEILVVRRAFDLLKIFIEQGAKLSWGINSEIRKLLDLILENLRYDLLNAILENSYFAEYIRKFFLEKETDDLLEKLFNALLDFPEIATKLLMNIDQEQHAKLINKIMLQLCKREDGIFAEMIEACEYLNQHTKFALISHIHGTMNLSLFKHFEKPNAMMEDKELSDEMAINYLKIIISHILSDDPKSKKFLKALDKIEPEHSFLKPHSKLINILKKFIEDKVKNRTCSVTESEFYEALSEVAGNNKFELAGKLRYLKELIISKEQKHSLDHCLNPKTYYQKYQVNSFDDLINKIPEVCADVNAIKCIFYNSLGNSDYEKHFISRVSEVDAYGKTLLHYLADSPEISPQFFEEILKRMTPTTRILLLRKKDNDGMTPVYLVAKNADIDKMNIIYFQADVSFECDFYSRPNLFDVLYQCSDHIKVITFMKEFLRFQSVSARIYFMEKYGISFLRPPERKAIEEKNDKEEWLQPDVIKWSQEYKSKTKAAFDFYPQCQMIMNLDYYLSRPADVDAQVKALKFINDLRKDKLTFSQHSLWIDNLKRINFVLIRKSKSDLLRRFTPCFLEELKIDFVEKKENSQAVALPLAAENLNLCAEYLNKQIKGSVHDVYDAVSLVGMISELKDMSFCPNIAPLSDMLSLDEFMRKTFSSKKIEPYNLESAVKALHFKNINGLTDLFAFYCHNVAPAFVYHFIKRLIQAKEYVLAKLVISLAPKERLDFYQYGHSEISCECLLEANRRDMVSALLEAKIVAPFKAAAHKELWVSGEDHPINKLINLCIKDRKTVIALLKAIAPKRVENAKLNNLLLNAIDSNDAQSFFEIFPHVIVSDQLAIDLLYKSFEKNNIKIFEASATVFPRNHLRKLEKLIINLLKTKSNTSVFCKALANALSSERYSYDFDGRMNGVIRWLNAKVDGSCTAASPPTEYEFERYIIDLNEKGRDSINVDVISIILSIDASGYFGERLLDSWRSANLLQYAMNYNNQELINEIIDYRHKLTAAKAAEAKLPVTAKHVTPVIDLSDNPAREVKYPQKSSMITLNPEETFKKYKVKTIDELIDKFDSIIKARDMEAVELIVFNSVGYLHREMLLKMKFLTPDHSGRTVLHYLVGDALLASRDTLELILDKIMPESRVNGCLQIEDHKGESCVQLAATKYDFATLNVLRGKNQLVRSLDFDHKRNPNLLHMVYLNLSRDQLNTMVRYLIENSESAKDYFYEKYGPKPTGIADEYKQKRDAWFNDCPADVLANLILIDYGFFRYTKDKLINYYADIGGRLETIMTTKRSINDTLLPSIYINVINRFSYLDNERQYRPDYIFLNGEYGDEKLKPQAKIIVHRMYCFVAQKYVVSKCAAVDCLVELKDIDLNLAKRKLFYLDRNSDTQLLCYEITASENHFLICCKLIIAAAKIARDELTKTSMFGVSGDFASRFIDPFIKAVSDLMDNQELPLGPKTIALKQLLNAKNYAPALKDTLFQLKSLRAYCDIVPDAKLAHR